MQQAFGQMNEPSPWNMQQQNSAQIPMESFESNMNSENLQSTMPSNTNQPPNSYTVNQSNSYPRQNYSINTQNMPLSKQPIKNKLFQSRALLCAPTLVITRIIFLILFLAIVIVEFNFGVKGLSLCPINSNIPIYLVVAGCTDTVLVFCLILVSLCGIFVHNQAEGKALRIFCAFCMACSMFLLISVVLYALFYLAWLITGTVWVARARPNIISDDLMNTSGAYCDQATFNAALATIIVKWCLPAICCCLQCCLFCFQLKRKDPSFPITTYH